MRRPLPTFRLIREFLVEDVDTVVEYYCTALGFRLVGVVGIGPRKKARLERGDATIVFESLPAPSAAPGLGVTGWRHTD